MKPKSHYVDATSRPEGHELFATASRTLFARRIPNVGERVRSLTPPTGTADSGAVGSVVRAHKNAVPNVRREPVFDVNVLRGGVA